MNSLELTKLMKRNKWTKKYFLGCFPSDKIPYSNIYPHCIIVNSDGSESENTHWLAIFVTNKHIVEYYDSFGEWPPPSNDILNYLQNFSEVVYHTNLLQSPLSEICGRHTMYFLIKRSQGNDFEKIIHSLTSKRVCADRVVNSYVRYHFFYL